MRANTKPTNDVSYTPDGDAISVHSACPTHMQTSVPGVVMNIDGDRFLLGQNGQPALRYTSELYPNTPWI